MILDANLLALIINDFVCNIENETYQNKTLIIKDFGHNHKGIYKCQVTKTFESGRTPHEIFSEDAELEVYEMTEGNFFYCK
jgi:hypothetical protein